MKKRVLIVCTGNSCRSQMAEGLWRELGGGEWECHSAGSRPTGHVHPLAVEALAEIGIDIAAGRSKSVSEFADQSFDVVVTVCDHAKETCPVWPEARELLHWPFEDPVAPAATVQEALAAFREVRDRIRAQIQRYLTSPA